MWKGIFVFLVSICFAGYPLSCPPGFRQVINQKVSSHATLSVPAYPGHAVTYYAGTSDGSSIQFECAQGFATFIGDGYMKWGPVTNNYATFNCNVSCLNSVQSCPVVVCDFYSQEDTKDNPQRKAPTAV